MNKSIFDALDAWCEIDTDELCCNRIENVDFSEMQEDDYQNKDKEWNMIPKNLGVLWKRFFPCVFRKQKDQAYRKEDNVENC